MKILRHTERGFAKKIRMLNRAFEPTPEVQSTVCEILRDVKKRGDAALVHYTKKFGGGRLKPSQLRVGEKEIVAATESLTVGERHAILAARANVLKFAKQSLRKTWFTKNAQGAVLGERFDPFERVGIYVPGGTAPLVSSAVMTCTLALAAQVPEIVVMTPGGADGCIHRVLLAAISLCGATEIYRLGGAQAIAALAYGTKTITAVQKVFGPGNAYGVEAKRQVFGTVAVDLLPGPSEVLVIADASANPEWVAADLLAQSEHGKGSIAMLFTDSSKQLEAVRKAAQNQMKKFHLRATYLAESWKNACLVHCSTMEQCIQLANGFASEHVSVATRNPEAVAARLTTAGAIFLNGISPVAAGDFLAGPSHVLPTGGAGRSFSGLTADQFQRRTSLLRFDEVSLRKSLPILKTFCDVEGLDAHAYSVSVRISPEKHSEISVK